MTLPRARSLPLLGCIGSGTILAALTVNTEVRARAWTVLTDGTGNAPTIQAAVDSCAAGDSVLVGEGTFFESVVIGVPLSIIGLGAGHSSEISAAGGNYCLITSGAVDPLVVVTIPLDSVQSFMWTAPTC